VDSEPEEAGCEEKGQIDRQKGRGVIPLGGKEVGEVGEGNDPVGSHYILRLSTWHNALGE